MSSRIKILPSPNFTQEIVLAGLTYNILFTFNDSDKAWYLSISDSRLTSLVSGIKVMPNQNLTKVYSYLNIFPDGDIWCLRLKNDFSPIGYENLGIDKSYEIVWIPSNEVIERGLENVIQL